jgi:DNA-binding transcriptional MerR regulator
MATATLSNPSHKPALPPVPAKRYFTIGEVSDLCLVKQHVLRYWEQEFAQLKPMKRRGNRRYYQHHEVMLIRRIRSLLYDEGFTISGARVKLESLRGSDGAPLMSGPNVEASDIVAPIRGAARTPANTPAFLPAIRTELVAIRALLESPTL